MKLKKSMTKKANLYDHKPTYKSVNPSDSIRMKRPRKVPTLTPWNGVFEFEGPPAGLHRLSEPDSQEAKRLDKQTP